MPTGWEARCFEEEKERKEGKERKDDGKEEKNGEERNHIGVSAC